jgi:hypothetical protein
MLIVSSGMVFFFLTHHIQTGGLTQSFSVDIWQVLSLGA